LNSSAKNLNTIHAALLLEHALAGAMIEGEH